MVNSAGWNILRPSGGSRLPCYKRKLARGTGREHLRGPSDPVVSRYPRLAAAVGSGRKDLRLFPRIGSMAHISPPNDRKSRGAIALAASFTFLLLAGTIAVPSSVAVGVDTVGEVRPVRAAFYYPWFPETEHWSTRYQPSIGLYNSSDKATLNRHVSAAKYAGLDAFVSSYWGRSSKTAHRLPLLLEVARAQNFLVTPYYEPESNPTPPTAAALRADFDALAALSADPAWLTMNGKPVLFVYNTGR